MNETPGTCCDYVFDEGNSTKDVITIKRSKFDSLNKCSTSVKDFRRAVV